MHLCKQIAKDYDSTAARPRNLRMLGFPIARGRSNCRPGEMAPDDRPPDGQITSTCPRLGASTHPCKNIPLNPTRLGKNRKL